MCESTHSTRSRISFTVVKRSQHATTQLIPPPSFSFDCLEREIHRPNDREKDHLMSFADFAGSSNYPTGVAADRQVSIAKSKLEQLQRQVIALKRSVSDKNSSGNAINDDDLRERIHFASQLHEELPKAIAMIPEDATYSFVKRKLCKDFRILTRQWADVMQGVDRTKEPKDKVEDIFKRAEDEYRKALAKIMRGEDPEERDAEASSYEVTEY